MTRTLIKCCLRVMVASPLWAFVGIEHVVGYHELGSSWEPFMKHRPSLQVRFKNPAQKGLDLAAFDSLSPTEQIAFVEFCTILFGMHDPAKCDMVLRERSI